MATGAVNSGNGIAEFALGDLDNDSDIDVVTGSENLMVNSVHIHLGNGFGGFSTSTVDPGGFAKSAKIADFSGDGNLDVAIISFGLRVFLGDGSGMVGPGNLMSPSMGPGWLVVGDYTADGQIDAFTTHSGHGELSTGQGNGLFGAPQSIGIENGFAMASADFDNDGDDDVAMGIAASCNGCTDAGIVFYRNGAGMLVEEVAVETGELFPNAIAVGELNGDDIPDLAIAHLITDPWSFVTVLLSAP